MLDSNTAKIVCQAINEQVYDNVNVISPDLVCKMQPIVQDTNYDGYTILALQKGNFTILVCIQFDEKLGVLVQNIQTQYW